MDEQHPENPHAPTPGEGAGHHFDCPARDGSMFCLCEVVHRVELRVLAALRGDVQLTEAHLEVDGDGTTRVLYADDCSQVLVSRELLDRVVADFNMRSDWITPAEHLLAVQQAEQRVRAELMHGMLSSDTEYQLGYEQGKRDMLARCIAEVKGEDTGWSVDYRDAINDVLDALQELGGDQ